MILLYGLWCKNLEDILSDLAHLNKKYNHDDVNLL